MNRKKIIILLSIICLSICLIIYLFNSDKEYIPKDDEIVFYINLNIKEDIGLFIYDYDVDGYSHGGGMSNANKSPIKHNETIIYTMNKEYDLNNLETINNLKMEFSIVTKYHDPNYDNNYPSEDVKKVEGIIELKPNYGEKYIINIIGDVTNGYQATLE